MARDPFGIKPLYIAQVEDGLAFASEPQALLEAGLVKRAVRPAAVEELLQLQFTTGADTIFEGIQRLLPGETITCADGHILDRRRISPMPAGAAGEHRRGRRDAAAGSGADWRASICISAATCRTACSCPAASTVRVLITLMSRLNDEPVLAFTAGFDAPGSVDEREHADDGRPGRRREARIDRDHRGDGLAASARDRGVRWTIPPWTTPSSPPGSLPAGRARTSRWCFRGEGGDEIFGGYKRYRQAVLPWWRGGRTMWADGSFDKVPVLRSRPTAWRDGMAAAAARSAEGGRSALAAAQALDMTDWLPHDLLLKLDRCLMAHAVEGRTPFLDRGVAAAAFRLPDSMKLRRGMGKWILRKWLEQNLPMARPFAPKTGFTVPVGAWIKSQGTRLGPLVAAQPGVAEIAHPDQVEALFRRHQALAAWLRLLEAAVLRAVASSAHSGAAAGRGRVRDAGGTLEQYQPDSNRGATSGW